MLSPVNRYSHLLQNLLEKWPSAGFNSQWNTTILINQNHYSVYMDAADQQFTTKDTIMNITG